VQKNGPHGFWMRGWASLLTIKQLSTVADHAQPERCDGALFNGRQTTVR